MRRISHINTAQQLDMDGLDTWMALPFGRDQHMDPFLLLNHHGPQHFEPNNSGLPFAPHPHRGFETLTFVISGDVVHRDSTGSESVIGPGGIQWMTAGRGIVHEEVSSEEFKKTGGDVEVLQLWMNLPARLKMTDPNYVGVPKSEIPVVSTEGGAVRIRVISGEYNGETGPVSSLTHLFTSRIDLDRDAVFDTHVSADRTVLLYVIRGTVEINGFSAAEHQIAVFDRSGETAIQIKAFTDAMLIFCHGEPYNEPIVARGPFVMNTHQEVLDAFADYQDGKFE